jgi:hypothetical protein
MFWRLVSKPLSKKIRELRSKSSINNEKNNEIMKNGTVQMKGSNESNLILYLIKI